MQYIDVICRYCLTSPHAVLDADYCYRRRDVAWTLINPRDGIGLQTQLDDLCDNLEWSSVVA